MSTPAPAPAPRLPGVVDTLTAGYRTVNHHPWLLLLPVVLDLFYWLGPRLSVGPLARDLAQTLEQTATVQALRSADPEVARTVELMKSTLETGAQGLNLFSLLSANSPLGMPSLVVIQDTRGPAWLGAVPALEISSSGGFMRLLVLLLGAGILLGAVYLGFIAQVVRDGGGRPGLLLRRVGLYAGRFIALLAALIMASLLLGMPVGLVIGMAVVFSPSLGALLLAVLWAVLLWAYFYLFFAIDALFVSEVGALRAIGNSIAVVRMGAASALGLFLASIVISLGMPYVWSALGLSEPATIVGILGNAYIGTGLVVASMIFYRDRIAARQGAVAAPAGPGQRA